MVSLSLRLARVARPAGRACDPQSQATAARARGSGGAGADGSGRSGRTGGGSDRPPRPASGSCRAAALAAVRERFSSDPSTPREGLAFDAVFVPGLAEKMFPTKIVEEPILLDVVRAQISAILRRIRHVSNASVLRWRLRPARPSGGYSSPIRASISIRDARECPRSTPSRP